MRPVEGLSTKYGSAFRQSHLAAREAGAGALTGTAHPQLETSLVAESAARYAAAEVALAWPRRS